MNEINAEARAIAREFDQGRFPKQPIIREYFESLEAVRTMLTDNRLQLWRTIRDKKPASILELAKMVDRDFAGVHRDLNILVSVGLVALKAEKGKRGDVQRPVSLCDALSVEVA